MLNDDASAPRKTTETLKDESSRQQPIPSAVHRSADLLQHIRQDCQRSQTRVEVIQKLRRLKARSEGTKLTQHSTCVGLESSTVSAVSSEMSETNSSVSTKSAVAPMNIVVVEFSSSCSRNPARLERDRANKFLVELAKAKAEVLRLRQREAALAKNNQTRLPAERHSAFSWTPRFWRKKEGDPQRSWSEPAIPLAGNAVESPCGSSSTCDIPTDSTKYSDLHQGHHHTPTGSESERCNRTIQENRQLLEELMQVMNSLSVRSDLSVQLQLRPCANGWSVDSATVKRVERSVDDAEI